MFWPQKTIFLFSVLLVTSLENNRVDLDTAGLNVIFDLTPTATVDKSLYGVNDPMKMSIFFSFTSRNQHACKSRFPLVSR